MARVTGGPKLEAPDVQAVDPRELEEGGRRRGPAEPEQAPPPVDRIAPQLEPLAIAIGELERHPRNPRRHPHLAELKASLNRWGQVRPILAQASTGYIVAGNGLHQAAEELGWTRLAANVHELSNAEADAYLIADNRLGELGGYDEAALIRLLEEADAGAGMEGTGWSVDELERMLRNAGPSGRTEPDEAPALPERAAPWVKPGQLWELGEHRLAVGDAADRRTWQRLAGGDKLDMIWTDPPYGVGYYGKTAEKLTIEGDLRGETLEELLRAAFGHGLELLRPGRAVYCAGPGGDQAPIFYRVLMDAGVYRQTIVWVKDVFVMGRSDYHWRHEPLLTGAKPRRPARAPKHKAGTPVHYGWKPGAAHYFCGDRDMDTVWEFDRPKASRQHPTMKPVALVERSLLASSKRGDIVADPFVGSGTTIIAAEITRRRCYAIELDPRYAQVSIERWQTFTGGEPRLVA